MVKNEAYLGLIRTHSDLGGANAPWGDGVGTNHLQLIIWPSTVSGLRGASGVVEPPVGFGRASALFLIPSSRGEGGSLVCAADTLR
jgi:hypothetical protein